MSTQLQPGCEIYWWRRISGSIDFPYKGKIVKVSRSRLTVCVEDAATGIGGVIRHVSRERVQLIGEYCAKIEEQGPSLLPTVGEWGRFTRYAEVAEDLRTKRQVDIFENGNMLRYDRAHWVDAYGMLGDARINRSQPAGPWGKPEEVSVQVFQTAWVEAGRNSLWKQQLESSRSGAMGTTPIWLLQEGWRPPAII